MVDLQFADTIASALRSAMVAAQDGDRSLSERGPEYLQRVCRRAAWQLMFDLDGQSLLDLALAKLSAEQSLSFSRAA